MIQKSLFYQATWQEKLYGYLSLARLSNSPTVVSNVLAGAALAGVTDLGWPIFCLAVAMVFFYTGGMYLNDLFDYEIDCRERPERPLPSGLISRTSATVVTVALFTLGSALLATLSPRSFLSGLLLMALIVLYNWWHKTNSLSPLIMALTRVMVYLTAFLSFRPFLDSRLLFAASLLLLYIVGLTYIAKSETKYTFSQHWPALLLFLPVGFPFFQGFVPLHAALLLLFVGWVTHSISFIYQGQIGGGITRLIAGISLLDGLVLTSTGTTTGVYLALLAFELTVLLQRYIKGT